MQRTSAVGGQTDRPGGTLDALWGRVTGIRFKLDQIWLCLLLLQS